MSKVCFFAVAGLIAAGISPPAHAGDTVRLVGGCPSIAQRPDCPGAPAPPLSQDYPQGAAPGQCFAQVRTAPTFESYTEQVVVSPGHVERRHVPAQYAWTEHQVLLSPGHDVRRMVPATYRSVTETVVISPATTRVETIAPVYDTVSEQVMTRPAHTEWRRTFVGPDGVLPPGAHVWPTGEVVCLVEVPAQYGAVQRQVLREPGRTVETQVPAVTQTVTRQVIDRPAYEVVDHVPPVYGSEKVRRLVAPARTVTFRVAPVFALHEKQREVSAGGLEWRRVDCSVKDTPPPPR
jgi:hypothetical protein